MNSLYLKETEFTPEITLDGNLGICKIKGESVPENARLIFLPVLEWIEDFKTQSSTKQLNMTFSFDYLNSLSLKYVYDIIVKLEGLTKDGFTVNVIWDYMKDDDEMKENGEELSKLVKTSFKIIER